MKQRCIKCDVRIYMTRNKICDACKHKKHKSLWEVGKHCDCFVCGEKKITKRFNKHLNNMIK